MKPPTAMPNRRRLTSAIIGSCLLVGLGTPGKAECAAPRPVTISIKSFMFSPSVVKIEAGSVVTWINHDDEPHTVVSDTGLFRSSAIDTNEKFVFTFDKPGTYHFTCSIHPKMIGTIVVNRR